MTTYTHTHQLTESQHELLWQVAWAITHGYINNDSIVEPDITNDELNEFAALLKSIYWDINRGAEWQDVAVLKLKNK